MPTAPVDDHGTVLFYEDSGAPDTNDYTTLVLIHGTCFHSATYRPLVPFAQAHNLRLVLLNMRGYPGSTPYTEAELERLGGSSEDRALALQDRGLELAAFLQWFIETERIPPLSPEARVGGGLSLLAWSGGNHWTFAMFAHADALPAETRTLLEGYLRTLIMYDPSTTSIGCETPPGFIGVNPAAIAAAPLSEKVAAFAKEVGSFYAPFTLPHSLPSPSSGALSSSRITRIPLQDLPREPGDPPFDAKYAPSVFPPKMSAAELAGMTHPDVLVRVQPLIWAPALRAASVANVARTLYDCRILPREKGAASVVQNGNGNANGSVDEESSAKGENKIANIPNAKVDGDGKGNELQGPGEKVWPHVRAHLLFCNMTVGAGAWASSTLKCGHAAAPPAARRALEVHTLEDANHFIHWEAPEDFLNALAVLV